MISVAVLHQKGGSGKTTIAVNLAAAAHLAGLRTTIIDTDVQASAMSWSAERREGSRLEGIAVALALGKGKAAEKVARSDRKIALPRFRELAQGYDVAIIDGPARESGITMSAAAFADIALVPIAPGPTDFWTVRETTLEAIDRADEVRAELGRAPVKRCFVVNAARIGTVLAREAQEEIEREELGAFVGIVHHRVTFPVALSRGESVLTLPAAAEAAAEIAALWRALKGAHAALIEEPRRKATSSGSTRSRRVALRR